MAPAARTAASVIMASLCLAIAPAAQANHINGWQDGEAGVPASVDLTEVAAFGASGVVIAVGKDSNTGLARIFRRVGVTWIEDTVTLPAGAQSSELMDVDLDQDIAWAVGSYADGSAVTHPLTLRIAGGSTAVANPTAVTWAPAQDSLGDGVVPTAVAVRGNAGMIGTAAGTVFPFQDAGGPTGADGTINDTAVAPPQPAGAINAIAVYDTNKAFTGGNLPASGADRIYKVDSSQSEATDMLPVTGPSDPNLPIAGLAAVSESEGIAVEANPGPVSQDPRTWSANLPLWTRDADSALFTLDSKPADLSARKPDATLIQAVAGTHGGAGAVWRRTGTGAWTRQLPSPNGEALHGVAVITEQNIWAVGDDGVLLNYGPLDDADPPNTFIEGPAGNTPDPMATFSFSSDTGTSFECSVDGGAFVNCTSPRTIGPLGLGPHTFQVKASGPSGTDLTPATRTVTVVPPETFLDGPSGTTSDSTPTFAFSSDYAGASFQCSIDGGAFFSCASPITISQLAEGDHIFQVRAVSSAAADPSPAARSFKVDVPDSSTPCKQVPSPLVSGVTVRKRPGKLLIEFDLAAAARVKAKAYHGGELIGRTKEKVFKQGHHELKLRYGRKKGKPTNLKMLARPAAADACP
jgi:hypothetical protein